MFFIPFTPKIKMPFLSKAVHYAFDAALVSTLLAGVKRTTGYS